MLQADGDNLICIQLVQPPTDLLGRSGYDVEQVSVCMGRGHGTLQWLDWI
jgi:hypothetical protein